jgi:hypothetical protein
VALGAWAAVPAGASTGPSRYIYEVCDSALPGGGTPEAHFVVNPGVALTGFNNCAQPGGSIGIVETGHVSGTFSFWNLPIAATPGGKIESVTVTGQACSGPGTLAFAFEQGWPVNCGAESQHVFHSGGGGFIYLGCDGNYAPGCEAGRSVSAHYMAATEVDSAPPTLASVGGSLLSGDIVRGHQAISAEAADKGGGLSKVSVTVNNLPAAETVPNCNLTQANNASVVGTVAVTITPCPVGLKPSWTLDTAAYPFHDGANTVQVCASDFSTIGAPNTTCTTPQSVEVDNSCTESPVVGGEVLSARFAASNSEEITVPFDHPAEVTGELADNAGDPIRGATICVQTQTQGSAGGLVPLGTATTDANGHFSYQLAPGPNRKVLVGYRHDTFQVARSVRYFAHAKPTLRLSPATVKSGGRIRISGTVPGPGAGGRVVVLQASAPHSGRWYTFHRATADPQGVFHSRYRFDATTQTTTYRIRALIPRQAGYPWEAGHSKPALVQVRG